MKGIPINTFQYRCRQVRLAMEKKLKEDKLSDTSLVPVKNTVSASGQEPFFAKVEFNNDHNIPSGINIRFEDSFVNIAPDAPDSHVRMVLEVITNAK